MPSPTEVAPTTYPGGPPSRRSGWPWKRWLPLAVLVGLMALVFTTGWHDFLSLKTVGTNYDRLRELISADLPASLALYIAIYIAAVALSLPAAGILTITGGLLFGWQIGAPAAIAGATTGATVIFLIARSSIGDALASRAGPWLGRMREGFQRNALSYVLFLRLVPAFRFAVVNLAAAVLRVPLKTFVIGTALGIVPGAAAFSMAGASLASVVGAQNAAYKACLARVPASQESACPYTIDTSALITHELLIALAVLGAVALLPVTVRWWRARPVS